mgnify:CR=1 FL=1
MAEEEKKIRSNEDMFKIVMPEPERVTMPAREVADQVVFIDHGQIIEQAVPHTFFHHPQHARAQQFLQQLLNPLHAQEVLL